MEGWLEGMKGWLEVGMEGWLEGMEGMEGWLEGMVAQSTALALRPGC